MHPNRPQAGGAEVREHERFVGGGDHAVTVEIRAGVRGAQAGVHARHIGGRRWTRAVAVTR